MAVVPWPQSRWSLARLFDENRGLKGKREGEFKAGRSGLLLKRKTCLVFPVKSHNAPVQLAADGERVSPWSLCVGMALSLSYSLPCFG